MPNHGYRWWTLHLPCRNDCPWAPHRVLKTHKTINMLGITSVLSLCQNAITAGLLPVSSVEPSGRWWLSIGLFFFPEALPIWLWGYWPGIFPGMAIFAGTMGFSLLAAFIMALWCSKQTQGRHHDWRNMGRGMAVGVFFSTWHRGIMWIWWAIFSAVF